MENIVELFRCSDYREIFNALQDDESKEIYKSRIMYSFTGYYDYVIDTIGNLSPANMQDKVYSWFYNKLNHTFIEFEDEFIGQIDKVILSGRKVVLCGAKGRNASHILARLSNKDVILCDKEADGHTFFSYQEIFTKDRDALWVVPCYQYEEIIADLLELGINKSDIVHFDVTHRNEWCKTIMKNLWSVEEIDAFMLLQHGRKEYFDEKIIKPVENEVFIDCGFYDGATSKQFTEWCNGDYRKIVAFEADERLCKTYEDSEKIEGLELINAACWNKDGQLIFHNTKEPSEIGFIDENLTDGIIVEARTIDGVLNGGKATFIKMDIEGSELNALKGAEYTIREYRPRLAISVYHRPEDIIDILRYILKLCGDYKFYLRAYEYNEAGVVLYAV